MLVNGEITVDEWSNRFYQLIAETHSLAADYGAGLAGKDIDDDLLKVIGRGIADEETEFIDKFAADIRSGRYTMEDGRIRLASLNNRTDLYVKKARGTANESFVTNSPKELLWDWEVGIDERHCLDCPEMAAAGPYTQDTLFSYPGDGSTECLGNCLCVLVRSDGVRGPEPFKFGGDQDAANVPTSNPAPAATNGSSIPVSNSVRFVNSGIYDAQLKDALKSIDFVHSDGDLKPLPVTTKQIDDGSLGEYIFTFTTRDIQSIVINPDGAEPQLTFCHEMGHALAINVIGQGKPVVGKAALFKEFRDAVQKTPNFAYWKYIYATANPFGQVKEHAGYLLLWEEIWARAYCQFIAETAYNKELTEEFVRNMGSQYQSIFGAQWDENDFKEIKEAIRRIFQKIGWMPKDK